MGKALFYHLTRSPAEALLPVLLTKALSAGWRVELRAPDAARLDMLDQQLWQGDGFLPHGLAGGPNDARQPVLLTLPDQPAANAPACLMAVDGVPVTADQAQALDRTCILFDGGDPNAVARARDQWRQLTAAAIEAEYWSEESGRWERKR
ncbi:DNA polymerase III subunit chi [Paracoccus hibiscisoli]|uniref:DNA polymerase III subunit chi n=1 Tax=Paracoccus hibiscisoli TaxID=2023261 RepID=A0A4U0QSR0_9RHOB|nr:DNA polymerase III subunit chi [Paracoccus hibiscisoli]TJZ84926.1 DNA polymerase III subunit chi [Paracoccus hibiscisoli]